MNGAAAWIGPAIVAAVISAIVTGLGWFVSERQAARREAAKRRERVVDMQAALLAEIRAGRHRIEDLAAYGAMLDDLMEQQAEYTPFVPRQVDPVVFGAIRADIHILPTAVIDPVVVYYRQLAVLSNLADDLRSERYERLDQDRKRLLYRDFVGLMQQADVLAADAEAAIYVSLNIRASGSSGQKSAAVPVGASVSRSSSWPSATGSHDHNREPGT